MGENKMQFETGTIGLLGWNNQRITVDGWEIDHSKGTAKAFCDLQTFKERFDLTQVEYRPVLGSEWIVRFDNESHLYFGSTRCFGLAFPDVHGYDHPKEEDLSTSLSLYFQFKHSHYGPYHVAEGRAMARRGNDMFFDLLTLEEIDRRAAAGDLSFTSYVNSRIFHN